MTMSRRSRLRLCIALAAGLSSSIARVELAHAQQNTGDPTVFLNANDSTGTSSFATAGNWLPTGAPTSGNAYVVTGSATGTGQLRSPLNGSTGATFAGDSLTIIPYNGQANLYNTTTTITNAQDTTAGLFLYGNTSGQSVTIANLELANGGAIVNSTSNKTVLNGNIYLAPIGTTIDGITTTTSGGIIDVSSGSGGLVINSTLSGTGMVHILSTSTSSNFAALNSSNASFTGGFLLDNTIGFGAVDGSFSAPVLDINNPNALGTGTFTVISFTGNGITGPTIDNTTGAAETLATNTPQQWNGGFQFQGSNALNLGSGAITVGNPVTLIVEANILSTAGSISTGGNVLTIAGAGAFELTQTGLIGSSNVTVAPGGTLAANVLAFSPGQITALTAQATFQAGSFLGIDTAGTAYNMSASLPAGIYGVNKIGAGTLILSGNANAYTGPTNISTGVLQVGNATALSSSSGIGVSSGAILDLNGYSISVASFNGSGTITNSTSTPVTLTVNTGGPGTFSGNLSNGAATTSLNINLASSTAAFNMSGSTNTYTGNTTLTNGTLFVSAASLNASSAVVFNGGTLALLAQPITDPSLAATVTAGNGYSYNIPTGSILLGGAMTGATTSFTKQGVGALNLSNAASTYGGPTNILSGDLTITAPGNLGNTSGVNVAQSSLNPNGSSNLSGSTFNASGSTNYALSMPVSGLGNFQKSGANTVVVSGANSYYGSTSITGGILQVGNASALGNTYNVSIGSSGTLDLHGYNISVGSLAGPGLVTNNLASPVALTLTTGGTTFTGNLSNGLSTTSLNVNLPSSTSVFTMSAATNSYSGSTTLNSGILVVGSKSLVGTSPVIFNGGSLAFSAQPTVDPSPNFSATNGNAFNFNVSTQTVVVTLAGAIGDGSNGPTAVTMSGPGILVLTGATTYTGSTTFNNGVLAFANPSALPTSLASGINVNSLSAEFGLGGGSTNISSFSLPISGPGGFAKVGSNLLTLTGTNNTYTGETLIEGGGTLQLGNANALGATSNINFGPTGLPGGTLDVNGYSVTLPQPVGGATSPGGLITNNVSTGAPAVVTLEAALNGFFLPQAAYFGNISGNISLVIAFPAVTSSSVAVQALEGTDTYTGSTTLQSGILNPGAAHSLPVTSQQIYFTGGWLEPSSSEDPTPGFAQVPNQQFNILASGTDVFASPINSSGGTLTLGNINDGIAGTLELTGTNNYTGATTVAYGTLQIGNPKSIGYTSSITVASYLSLAIGATPINGTLQLNDGNNTSTGLTGGVAGGAPLTLYLNGMGTTSSAIFKPGVQILGGSTAVQEGTAYYGALQGLAGASETWAGNIVLGNVPTGISGGFNNASTGGTLTVTGTISGGGPLLLGMNELSTTILAASNTYTGETQINNSNGKATTVQLGANFGIPAASGLNFSYQPANILAKSTFVYGTETFDLNGFNTSTAYVTTTSALDPGVVTNTKNSTTATLTMLGAASSPFLGVYQDGGTSGKLALVFGGGVQTISGTNAYSGGTTVTAGTVVASGLPALGTGSITLNGALNNGGGLIIQQTSPASILAKLRSGYNGGAWNGSGINSTYAASDTTHLTAVGMLTPASPITFEGQSINPGDVALKLTYYGDLNLDGQVDGSDYSVIDYSYVQDQTTPGSYTGWQNGDFNYDGSVNGSDYTLMDNAYNMQGAQFSAQFATATALIGGASGSAAVPEPTALALLGMGAGAMLGRRRRR